MKNLLLKLSYLLPAAMLTLAACSEDNVDEPATQEYCVTEFESTDMPATIPAEGGDYTLTFKLTTVTRAAQSETVFEPWSYRLTLDQAAADAVEVTAPTTEITVAIGENRSKEPRAVKIEMANGIAGEASAWTTIAEAQQEPALKDYIVTTFKSSNLPEQVPFNGGEYRLEFETATETRSAEAIFVEWQYRITTDGRIGDPVAVDNPTESISLPIPPNYTENHCTIVVEMADTDENPAWTKIAETRQEPALTLAAGFYWAKGNVTLKDGRFAIADRQSDPGLLFRHQSIYGVVNEGSTYGGTAYTPEAVTIALTDIPYDIDGADPCRLISDNLRTPSHAEMWYLYDVEDYQTLRSLDGINGMGYLDSDLFLPYCGVLDIMTGKISMRSQAGGYWGLGGNINGDGLIYVLNEEYSLLHYDLVGSNMASLRCVKNLRLPEYVSHTPQTVDNNASFKLTINLDHGELTHYRVALEADDGTYTETSAVESNPTVVMTVPENSSKQSREWHILVDGIDSGAKLVQPGMKDYALYVSHSPQKSGYEAFTLTVVCDSDMASFPVAAKGDDGTEITADGSSENTRVELTIPENSDKERTFSIWVNGIDTGRSVVQEACPDKSGFSVEWSSGYLTIVDGEYTFAAEKERGMYFKWHSKYGVAVDGAVTSKTKYEGVVYAPERQEIAAWDDVPYGDVDPCSLVAPAGTWYMPTLDQLKELTADGSKDWEKEVFRMCSDGSQQVYMATSGQLYKDGSKTMLPTIISIWSSEESASKAGQYCYMSWSTATTSNNPVLSTGGVVPNTAMMVRCVRNK